MKIFAEVSELFSYFFQGNVRKIIKFTRDKLGRLERDPLPVESIIFQAFTARPRSAAAELVTTLQWDEGQEKAPGHVRRGSMITPVLGWGPPRSENRGFLGTFFFVCSIDSMSFG